MGRAIGMVEYVTVSTGIQAADLMVKTAAVEILEAQTVCPGKYIVLISGDLSAVKASVEASKTRYGEKLVDSFVLGNPHESLFPALYGTAAVGEVDALGVIETFSAASILVAADAAAKTALVDLIEMRVARGMCGKSYCLLTGSVASVTAAIERARAEAETGGMYLDHAVIPHPDAKLWEKIL